MKPPIQGLLIDLDGVLYVGGQAVEGAREALEQVAELGLPRRFITNTTTRTPAQIVEKLDGLGFEVKEEEIFSALTATRQFLSDAKGGKAKVHLLLGESVMSEFSAFPQDAEHPDYVVVGDIGAAWSYDLLNRAFRELMAGAELIAMHKSRFVEREDGLHLDIGAFVAGLEFVTGQEARVIGKPSADFFRLAIEALDLPAKAVAMVGDDIDSDIGGAQDAGLAGILVRTGKYREEYVAASGVQPDLMIASLADLPGVLAAQAAG